MNPRMPILWIDPGKMTGLAVWMPAGSSLPGHEFWADEFEFMMAGNQIESICAWYGPSLRAGWEHFYVHEKTPGDDAHHAIEMIGVARRAITRYQCVQVGPAQPKQRLMATPRMLEAIGWWLPGKDDAQSAAQHLLAYMLRTGNVPDRENAILTRLRETMTDEDV